MTLAVLAVAHLVATAAEMRLEVATAAEMHPKKRPPARVSKPQKPVRSTPEAENLVWPLQWA